MSSEHASTLVGDASDTSIEFPEDAHEDLEQLATEQRDATWTAHDQEQVG